MKDTLPLLLVSQIQRSGGSLMAQLFDGHPELYAHPFEIHIGYPNKWNYPELSAADSPQKWLEYLYERKLDFFVKNGYAKPGGNQYAATERFEFNIDTKLLQKTFIEMVAKISDFDQRLIIDAYFKSFFYSWKNHLKTGKEKFYSGFTPRLALIRKSRELLFSDYPDAKIISIIRDPLSWYSSSFVHNSSHQDIKVAIDEWDSCTNTQLDCALKQPDRFYIILFEDLVTNPEFTLQGICNFSKINYDSCLLNPTFNGLPVYPNSSYSNNKKGIQASMAQRKNCLEKSQIDFITSEAIPTYDKAKSWIKGRQ